MKVTVKSRDDHQLYEKERAGIKQRTVSTREEDEMDYFCLNGSRPRE